MNFKKFQAEIYNPNEEKLTNELLKELTLSADGFLANMYVYRYHIEIKTYQRITNSHVVAWKRAMEELLTYEERYYMGKKMRMRHKPIQITLITPNVN